MKDNDADAAWKRFTGAKRITAELKALQRSSLASGPTPQVSHISLVGDDLFRWQFRVQNFDEDIPAGKALNKDLKQLGKQVGQSYLLMEANFPPDYPTNPFFLRLVSPRCFMYTGHVTAGGSICIEALVPTGGPGGWRPDYGVEGILVLVLANLLHAEVAHIQTPTGPGGISGPLRVDLSQGGHSARGYSMAEARAAYDRVVNNHGWKSRPAAAAGGSGTAAAATPAALAPPSQAAQTSARAAAAMPPPAAVKPSKKAMGAGAPTAPATALTAASASAAAAPVSPPALASKPAPPPAVAATAPVTPPVNAPGAAGVASRSTGWPPAATSSRPRAPPRGAAAALRARAAATGAGTGAGTGVGIAAAVPPARRRRQAEAISLLDFDSDSDVRLDHDEDGDVICLSDGDVHATSSGSKRRGAQARTRAGGPRGGGAGAAGAAGIRGAQYGNGRNDRRPSAAATGATGAIGAGVKRRSPSGVTAGPTAADVIMFISDDEDNGSGGGGHAAVATTAKRCCPVPRRNGGTADGVSATAAPASAPSAAARGGAAAVASGAVRAAVQEAADAQLAAALAQLARERRARERLEVKVADLAVKALLPLPAAAGGLDGQGAGPSTSAGPTGGSTGPGDMLFSAPLPRHWEPLSPAEGLGVKLVALPLPGAAAAAAAGSSSSPAAAAAAAAPTALPDDDVLQLIANGLTRSDATDLLQLCRGDLDKATGLALEALDCGGIAALLHRRRSNAAATQGDSEAGAAAEAAAREQALGAEVERVLARFEEASGLPRSRVARVERVQNWRLWTKYCIRRREIECLAGMSRSSKTHSPAAVGDLNEYYLWHGTGRAQVAAIVQDGFDMRVANRNGALGEGIYFAANASYSITYLNKVPAGHPVGLPAFHGISGAMLLCRVVLGRMAPGQMMMRKPPDGADSVQSNFAYQTPTQGKMDSKAKTASQRPGGAVTAAAAAADGADAAALWAGISGLGCTFISAVFDNGQAYPEYIVHIS